MMAIPLFWTPGTVLQMVPLLSRLQQHHGDDNSLHIVNALSERWTKTNKLS